MEINIPTAEEARKMLNKKTVNVQLEEVAKAINQAVKDEKKMVVLETVLMSDVEAFIKSKGYWIEECGKKTSIIWEK